MASEQQKRQYIGAGMLLLNTFSILLFNKYKQHSPASLSYLPLTVSFLIITVGACLMYYVSSKEKRFSLLMIPLTVMILAILTFLYEHF